MPLSSMFSVSHAPILRNRRSETGHGFDAQLNARSMRPKRDYRSNRLVGGALQLPPSSQLLLDETVMAAGTLAPTGVANLQVLTMERLMFAQYPYQFE